MSTIVNKTTGISPFECLYGHTPGFRMAKWKNLRKGMIKNRIVK